MKKGKKLNKRKQIYEYIMREKRLRKICTKRIKTKGQIEKDVKNREREKDGDCEKREAEKGSHRMKERKKEREKERKRRETHRIREKHIYR